MRDTSILTYHWDLLFQVLKYLMVAGQLCCFRGWASVDPFYKTTPVPAQWRPCPAAPHCLRNGRLQRIQTFFSHRMQLEAHREGSLSLLKDLEDYSNVCFKFTESNCKLFWATNIFFSRKGRHHVQQLKFWWKAKRRNQFCSSVTWQLTTETGMAPLWGHFLVPRKTQTWWCILVLQISPKLLLER